MGRRSEARQNTALLRERARAPERKRTRNENIKMFGYVHVYEHEHVHVISSKVRPQGSFASLPCMVDLVPRSRGPFISFEC
jgi:hypothetical protein